MYCWRCLCLICCFLAHLPVAAAHAPPSATVSPGKIETFVERCIASRRGAIARLEHSLRGLKNQRSTPQTARQIAKLEGDLQALRAEREPVVPTLIFPLSKGDIGRLPRLTCHVDQVLSDRELLVRCSFPLKVNTVEHFQGQQETVMQPVACLIRGVSTQDKQEGADTQLTDVLAITGQETYQTVAGRRLQVWILEPFDMSLTKPIFERLAPR